MTYLSLFSGCLGGDLGCQHLLGWTCKGYVEIDDYCQQVIRQRIKDGFADIAPIFGDIRTFIDQGYAKSYQGMVDCVTGGFPCQDLSNAGKHKGIKGKRSRLWYSMLETIRIIQPYYIFVENVPGILARTEWMGTVLGGLAESGYDCRWRCLSSAEMGAGHLRNRVWIVAHDNKSRLQGRGQARTHTTHEANIKEGNRFGVIPENKVPKFNWKNKPVLGRGIYESSNRVDRIKAIGEMQFPAVAATAWRLLR